MRDLRHSMVAGKPDAVTLPLKQQLRPRPAWRPLACSLAFGLQVASGIVWYWAHFHEPPGVWW
jgi:hypothetical protein